MSTAPLPAPPRRSAPAYLSLVPNWTYVVIDDEIRVRALRGRWSEELIVAAMRAWTKRHGSPPRSYEWAPATGRAAGLLATGPSEWELHHPRWPSTGTVAARFGSWCNGLRAAGLPARVPEHDLPRKERILAARRLSAAGLSVRAIGDTLGVGASTAHAYLRAGDCPACDGPLVTGAVCSDCAPRRRPSATRAEVLQSLRDWSTRFGEPPSQQDWKGWTAGPSSPWVREFPRWPSANSVRTHFGSWNAALAEAGLPLRRRSRWTREDIIEALRRWPDEHDGRPPRYADLRAAEDRSEWPDPKTVATAFGSWASALEAAGVRNAGGAGVDSRLEPVRQLRRTV